MTNQLGTIDDSERNDLQKEFIKIMQMSNQKPDKEDIHKVTELDEENI